MADDYKHKVNFFQLHESVRRTFSKQKGCTKRRLIQRVKRMWTIVLLPYGELSSTCYYLLTGRSWWLGAPSKLTIFGYKSTYTANSAGVASLLIRDAFLSLLSHQLQISLMAMVVH